MIGGGRPVAGERPGSVHIWHVGNDGIPGGTSLSDINRRDRIGVEGVGAEPVNGFGGERDEAPAAEHGGRVLDDHRVGIDRVELEDRSASHT